MKKLIFAILLSAALPAAAWCPLPPLPPIGCRVGPCVCDQNGQNCHYVFICN